MRIKLDENLPVELVAQLRDLGHDVEDVYSEHLSGCPDTDVWQAAQSEQRLLITQDIGFGDARMFTPGAHAGFMLLRMKRPDRLAVIAKLRGVFESSEVETWGGCFVVLSDSKLRVRRPN